MKKFTKEHEWISVSNGIGTVGITDYAQHQLGDVVYVSLIKKIGDNVKQFEEVAEIESVKSVSVVYSPASGKLIEFNKIFEDESKTGIINQDPYGEGWIFKLELTDKKELDSLMDENQYNEYIKNL